MFNLECIVYCIIFLYSVLLQIMVVINYKSNKKIKIKNGSGLYVAKDILNRNNLETLYVTKVNGSYNSYYDISRNVIHLSSDVYDEEDLGAIAISLFQVLKAIVNKNNDKKREKMKQQILDYSNKIFFVLFIIGASMEAFDIMSLSLLVLIVVIIIRYMSLEELLNNISDNINFIKKEYKIKREDSEKLENNLKILIFNELSLQIFNRKY